MKTQVTGHSRSLLTIALLYVFLSVPLISVLSAEMIADVKVLPESFNPTVGERATLTFSLETDAKISAVVLDRDAYIVRTLATDLVMKKGQNSLQWDGRDQHGSVVPDEAYSFKVDVVCDGAQFSYFPALKSEQTYAVPANYYDQTTGILSYTLNHPARVYAQAGVTKNDGVTGKAGGPVLAVIVSGEPRGTGPIVEAWIGLAGNGLEIPRLSGFSVAIAAQNLAKSSVIAVGNRARRFTDYATARKGKSLFTSSEPDKISDLKSFNHPTPSFKITARNDRLQKSQLLIRKSKSIKLTCELTGFARESLTDNHEDIFIYLDHNFVKRIKPTKSKIFDLIVPMMGIAEGEHFVAVNWRTPEGPVAIGVLRFKFGDPSLGEKK